MFGKRCSTVLLLRAAPRFSEALGRIVFNLAVDAAALVSSPLLEFSPQISRDTQTEILRARLYPIWPFTGGACRRLSQVRPQLRRGAQQACCLPCGPHSGLARSFHKRPRRRAAVAVSSTRHATAGAISTGLPWRSSHRLSAMAQPVRPVSVSARIAGFNEYAIMCVC